MTETQVNYLRERAAADVERAAALMVAALRRELGGKPRETDDYKGAADNFAASMEHLRYVLALVAF